MRELRNSGGHVLDRVAEGEHVVITRDGRPVAELRQLPSGGRSAAQLLARWARVPAVDPAQWRGDLDDVLDSRV